jgi:hypothetical protein
MCLNNAHWEEILIWDQCHICNHTLSKPENNETMDAIQDQEQRWGESRSEHDEYITANT